VQLAKRKTLVLIHYDWCIMTGMVVTK